MATNTYSEILIPKVLIIPNTGRADLINKAAIGTIIMSGAKLYVATSEGVFEKVTSA